MDELTKRLEKIWQRQVLNGSKETWERFFYKKSGKLSAYESYIFRGGELTKKQWQKKFGCKRIMYGFNTACR